MMSLTFCIVALLSVACFDVASSGGCQSYGHSCLGGHGKRSFEPPSTFQLLLQEAARARENAALDYRFPQRDAFDFLKPFTNRINAFENKEGPNQLLKMRRE